MLGLNIKTGTTINYKEKSHPVFYLEEDKIKYRQEFIKSKFNLSHGEGKRKNKRRKKK